MDRGSFITFTTIYPWSVRDQLEDTLYSETERERHVHIAENVHEQEWSAMVLQKYNTGHMTDCRGVIRKFQVVGATFDLFFRHVGGCKTNHFF